MTPPAFIPGAIASTEPMIYFGTDLQTGAALGIPRRTLHGGHAHGRGRTRSGKSATMMLPLAVQALDDYDDGGVIQRDAVVVIDLGGDQAFFHGIRDSVLGRVPSRRFRFLSLEPDDDWDGFDVFQSLPPDSRSAMPVANLLIESFNLDTGQVYGGQYFTGQNLAALLAVCRKLVQPGKPAPTLEQVAAYLDSHRKSIKDADQIRMCFMFLLEYVQLQREKLSDPDRRIDMERLLEDGEAAYFYLPTLGQATTARQVAGLALYTLVNAAMRRARDGKPLRRCWVFIDEFQELAGRSFAALLAQAAKFGITLVMANQSTAQLENRDTSLAQIVFDNTIVKQYHTVSTQQDVEELQLLSGEHEASLHGRSYASLTTSVTDHGVFRPRLDTNEVLEVSSTRGQSFLVLDDGQGYRPPYRVQGHYVTTKEVYEANRRRPLPRRPAPPPPPPGAASRGAPLRPIDPDLERRLVALLRKKEALESVSAAP